MWPSRTHTKDGNTGIDEAVGRIVEAVGKAVSSLLKRALRFAPHLFAAWLICRVANERPGALLWSVPLIVGIAILLAILEKALVMKLYRWKKGRTAPASVLFLLFGIVIILLHLWAIQAGLAAMLRAYKEGLQLSWFIAVLMVILDELRTARRRMPSRVTATGQK
jgi:hypothetical protein